MIRREDDMYSVAMMTLYLLRGKPQYSTLSELSYTLDKENFLNFISVFGGTTIYIPTKAEVEEQLRVIMYYYYLDIDGLSPDEACHKLGVDRSVARSLGNKAKSVREVLSEFKFIKRTGEVWSKKKK